MQKILFFLALTCVPFLTFGGHDERIFNWRPRPGRISFTIGFKITVETDILRNANRKKGITPFLMQTLERDFSGFKVLKLQFRVGSSLNDGYAMLATVPAARFNLWWRAEKSEVPTGQPVWVFLLVGAGKFDAVVNGRVLSHIRPTQILPPLDAAPGYRLSFGAGCPITDIMMFERLLTFEEIAVLSANPSKCTSLPGSVKLDPM